MLAEARDPRADRAAARWLARLTLECPDVTTRRLRAGLRAFDLVAFDRDGGRGQLAHLAAGLGIDDAHVLLRGAPAPGEERC